MNNSTFSFGTKSETLERLAPIVSQSEVLALVYFTQSMWQSDPKKICERISALQNQGSLIVRSSAINEDAGHDSMAGAFTSILNVPANDRTAVAAAIENVITSFQDHEHEGNQVLVQPMLNNLDMSGVIMTHDLQQGSPYYIINYDDESGLTDTVTSGTGIQKTVLIYRNCELSKLRSNRLRNVMQACQELESVCGNVPLDIEFAVGGNGYVYILQVRRISRCNTWHPLTERKVARQLIHVSNYLRTYFKPQKNIYGRRTILGGMPDWNPAEIIGSSPRPLASSLYRLLVTDSIWRRAREVMGYNHPKNTHLMVMIGHNPYIDVRLSFNSFLPANISPIIADKLVDAWLDRLDENPQWHDKVEFEITQTCLDFCFLEDFQLRYPNILTDDELLSFQKHLSTLTLNAIKGEGEGNLATALTDIDALSVVQKARAALQNHVELSEIRSILFEAKELGTLPFAIIARHAFIAESLLRSACRKGALSEERVRCWKQSIHTISTELTIDYGDVERGKLPVSSFLAKFGHLRPGTYDIMSLRYDERNDLFNDINKEKQQTSFSHDFQWSQEELSLLQNLLDELAWDIGASEVLDYASDAIQAREYAKFVFTRDLSDVLAMLTIWGADAGLSRENLSYLNIESILDSLTVPLLDDNDRIWNELVAKAGREYEQAGLLKLGHLICCPDDVYVVPLHRAVPNYITHESISADIKLLSQNTAVSVDIKGKIVCIENADPGYDWIFTKGIAGLVTQYGGTNSHMAIRCAEFGIPAAIGCGEQLFSRLRNMDHIELNCRDKTLRLVS